MRNSLGGSYEYNVICKVCGFKYKAAQTKRRWDGLEPVCLDCWEPRHPLDFYKTRDDTHRLSVISPEAALIASGMLDSDYAATTATATGQAYGTFGNRFTMLADRYATGLKVWVGALPANGLNTQVSMGEYVFLLYANTGPSLLWSKRQVLTPGQWNYIPITPNQALTSGAAYTAAVFKENAVVPFNYDTPRPTVATQTYCRYDGSHYNLTAVPTYPNSADDAANLYLIDVITADR